MKETRLVNFRYDKANDILYIDLGKPCAAYSEEVDDDVLVRINPKTNKPVGATIISFKEKNIRSLARKIPISLDWRKINEAIKTT